MSEAASRSREAVIARVLNGPGVATAEARRAAFDDAGVPEPARALIDKVVHRAFAVVDADIEAAKAGGLGEDVIFELAVCAALGPTGFWRVSPTGSQAAVGEIAASLASVNASRRPSRPFSGCRPTGTHRGRSRSMSRRVVPRNARSR